MSVRIQHYHIDDDRIYSKAFISSIHELGQTLSFCRVSTHNQNGIVERRVRDIQEHTRKMVLHVTTRWPSVTADNEWPYTMRYAVDIANILPNKLDGTTTQL